MSSFFDIRTSRCCIRMPPAHKVPFKGLDYVTRAALSMCGSSADRSAGRMRVVGERREGGRPGEDSSVMTYRLKICFLAMDWCCHSTVHHYWTAVECRLALAGLVDYRIIVSEKCDVGVNLASSLVRTVAVQLPVQCNVRNKLVTIKRLPTPWIAQEWSRMTRQGSIACNHEMTISLGKQGKPNLLNLRIYSVDRAEPRP